MCAQSRGWCDCGTEGDDVLSIDGLLVHFTSSFTNRRIDVRHAAGSPPTSRKPREVGHPKI
jgi:hypothetical protein